MESSTQCIHCGSTIEVGTKFCPNCGAAALDFSQPPPRRGLGPSRPEPSTWEGAPNAGFWIRAVASVIDVVIIGIVFSPFYVGLTPFGGAVLEVLAYWIYPGILESSRLQATIGKMICGLKVTDMEGRRITIGRAISRNVLMELSSLTLGIGFLMVAFTEKKQGLHDILAGTLVKKIR